MVPDNEAKDQAEGQEGQKSPEQRIYETPEQMADRKTRQALAESNYKRSTDVAKAQAVETRMKLFRQQVGPLVGSLTSEQRIMLAQELRKYDKLDLGPPNAGGAEPVTVGDPHAQLNANEAAKVSTAEAEVAQRQGLMADTLKHYPGEVLWEDYQHTCATIDGVLYTKIGDQWQVQMGHAGGQPQARWLSKQDAVRAGLEPDPEATKADPDGGHGGDWEPGLREGFGSQIDQAGPHAGAQPLSPKTEVEKPLGGYASGLDQQGKEEQN